MIGVITKPDQARVVEEFFELFKTPWEFYRPGVRYDVVIATADHVLEVDARLVIVCGSRPRDTDERLGLTNGIVHHGGTLSGKSGPIPVYGELLVFAEIGNAVSILQTKAGAAAARFATEGRQIVRLGYDLFDEARFLLSVGQPVECAHLPTLENHFQMLREWMLDAGVVFLEVLPVPAGYGFIACLTHDIDFIGIRNHFFDHSMLGFVYRATVGSIQNFLHRRIEITKVLKSWVAVASLPLVYLGWARDFWEPFDWYLESEEGLPTTYFLIPFKRRAGQNVPGRYASRRATAYDVSDLSHRLEVLRSRGCELAVHGIDAWHSSAAGRKELDRIATARGGDEGGIGIRMHWLLQDGVTASVLDEAGFHYDSTCGYNETIGYRCGTGQVFRPLNAKRLLELPLHIQDGALFYPQRLNLTEPEAEERCQAMVENAKRFGGVLTVLWHDRSHGPERFWGGFYKKLIQQLKSSGAWFVSALQTVEWFQRRRNVRFESIRIADAEFCLPRANAKISPAFVVRFYRSCSTTENPDVKREGKVSYWDIAWDGEDSHELMVTLQATLLPQANNTSAIRRASAPSSV